MIRTYKMKRDGMNGAPPPKAGELVYEFVGHDYGCSADDWRMGGIETMAMTRDPSGRGGPFFTVPVDAMELQPVYEC